MQEKLAFTSGDDSRDEVRFYLAWANLDMV
jgi:hypothetical protein